MMKTVNILNTAVMKCWSVTSNNNGFIAPELVEYRLRGRIYDDSRCSFPDGARVRTSSIQKITDCGTHKLVETISTIYSVYAADVDPEYEKAFPDAYKRLNMKRVEKI